MNTVTTQPGPDTEASDAEGGARQLTTLRGWREFVASRPAIPGGPAALGYAGSYSAFTRELRGHGISATCGTCRPWKPIAPAQPRQHYPGPLPFRIAPVGGEAIASYLSRVAAASHLPANVITACLPSWLAARAAACDDLAGAGQPQPADICHLAALTGISETALWHALPALAGTHDSGRRPVRAALACRRCAARAAHHGPARFISRRTSGPAPGTGPGSAAPSKSTSPPPRKSSAPGRVAPAPCSAGAPSGPRMPLIAARGPPGRGSHCLSVPGSS